VDAVARRAAALIADEARAAVKARGRFTVAVSGGASAGVALSALSAAAPARGRFAGAVSGGRTPWLMLRALSALDVPWPSVHVLQVDERIAPGGHVDRNLTHMRESLLAERGRERIHEMPVESADHDAAAARYAQTLVALAG